MTTISTSGTGRAIRHWLLAQLTPAQREQIRNGDATLAQFVERDIRLIERAKQAAAELEESDEK